MLKAQRRAGWSLRVRIQTLRPETRRAVTIGPKVQEIRSWRPCRRIPVTDRDPFLLGRNSIRANPGDEHAGDSEPVVPGVERDPGDIRSEARVVDTIAGTEARRRTTSENGSFMGPE